VCLLLSKMVPFPQRLTTMLRTGKLARAWPFEAWGRPVAPGCWPYKHSPGQRWPLPAAVSRSATHFHGISKKIIKAPLSPSREDQEIFPSLHSSAAILTASSTTRAIHTRFFKRRFTTTRTTTQDHDTRTKSLSSLPYTASTASAFLRGHSDGNCGYSACRFCEQNSTQPIGCAVSNPNRNPHFILS